MATRTKETTPEPESKNAPIHSANYRGVHLAVFKNIAEGQDGRRRAWFNTLVESRYRDSEGDYQSSSSFDEDQLGVLMDLIGEARTAIREGKREQKADDEF